MALTIEDLEARQEEIRDRLARIDTEFAGQTMPDEIRSEWNDLGKELKEDNAKLLSELRSRRDFLAAVSTDEERQEAGAHFNVGRSISKEPIWDPTAIRSASRSTEDEGRLLSENCKRAVDEMRFAHPDADRARSQGHIEHLMHKFTEDSGDRQRFSRHVLTTGSPAYRAAFAKVATGRVHALNPEEQRALSLTGASGGYAVPVTLDPTIIPTSNGAVNPMRQISRVEQITGNTWNGVSAGAVVASRDAEFEEISDDAPTLAQPTATVTKADVFIPFSIESSQDWGSLESEMARLIQDAKDVEESTAFMTGAGTGVNPQGVLTGATGTVAAGTAAFAVAHGYALLEALPPRFRPNGTFVANLAQYNRIRQLDTAGGASIWVQNLTQGIGNDANGSLGSTFLGKPAYESSVMSSSIATASKIMIFGDFRYYLIVDRIGMSIEVVPHIFGATNQRPIGARGLFAIWRNTGRVLSAAAFKVSVTT